MGFKRNVFGEQIVAVPVPQIGEPVGEVVQLAPRERVQSRTPEQIMDFPVPQNMEVYARIVRAPSQECVQNRMPDPIVDVPVPRIMEAAVEAVRDTPLERVPNRTPEPIVDVPVPHIKEDGLLLVLQERVHNRAAYTEKVFSVKLRDQRDDQACVNYMGFIKGLDKHNMPRLGDVMVPPLQIIKCIVAHVEQVVSWFDRKSQVAADEPLHCFQTSARAVAAAPSSNVGLLRFQQGWSSSWTCPSLCSSVLGSRRKLWRFRSCSSSTGDVAAWSARWNSGHYFFRPFLTVSLAEVMLQSRRLLDEFTVFFRRGHVVQHLVRQ